MKERQYSAIARAYAQALFGAARGQGIMQRAQEEAKVLRRVLEEMPTLGFFLENPRTPEETKQALLERVFRSRLSPLLMKLLGVLVDRHRTIYLAEMLELFQVLGEEAEGIFSGMVTSAHELDFQDKLKLKTSLENFTRCQLKLRYLVDDGLIGGIVFRFRDLLIDTSLSGELEKLRRMLLSTTLETPAIPGGTHA